MHPPGCRPPNQACSVFAPSVREGEETAIRVEVLAASATVTQARVAATQGDALVVAAFATLGEVAATAESPAKHFPRVPAPEDSPARTYLRAPLRGGFPLEAHHLNS